jgi:two-component sensor histidine kinase
LADLYHRLQNNAAYIGALIERARARADSVDALADDLTGRLDALARSHERRNGRNLTGICLRQLVEDELAPHRIDTNVSVEGADLPLIPERARSAPKP